MNRSLKFIALLTWAIAIMASLSAQAALPSDWAHDQTFSVSAAGMIKLNLPAATLDALRPGFEDLRLFDAAGNEQPYFIERRAPAARVSQAAKSFRVALADNATIITIETGLTQRVESVTLETAATNFIKPVQVEGSADGQTWQLLADGQPIFRQPYGATQRQVSFSPGVRAWLRLRVDDQRSAPIVFTGARVQTAAVDAPPTDQRTAVVAERIESPGESRLSLNLGSANLDLASVQLDTDEPLFTRTVSVAVPQVAEDGITEKVVGSGVTYRVAIESRPVASLLEIPLEATVPGRELILMVRNEDSPPLPVKSIRVNTRPVRVTFLARAPGTYHLLSGNPACAAPRYDLAALGADFKGIAVTPVHCEPLAANPDFRPREALAGLTLTGAALDVSAWKYRKPVEVKRDGAQQLELDLYVLAHAADGLADLRLLSGSNQVPYLVQRTSIVRTIAPVVTATNDPKDPHLSRWEIKLPLPGLPITRIGCVAKTDLFQRDFSLWEERADERGEKYRQNLATASWIRTPAHARRDFGIPLTGVSVDDRLILETGNGDNPAIDLGQFTAAYPVTRLLFKVRAGDPVFLYYGNPSAARPSYDLSLVSGELLSADKSTVAAGVEEKLKGDGWSVNPIATHGGVVFWGILALVVVGLLVIIAKLLPKAQPPAA